MVADQVQGPVASVPLLHSAADALAQARRKPGASQLSLNMDQLELCFLPDLCVNDPGAIPEKQPRIRYLLTCDSAKTRPDRAFYLQFLAGIMPGWFNGDIETTKECFGHAFLFLAREGCECAPDQTMREYCTIIISSLFGLFFETLPDDFDWRGLGTDGDLVRQGMCAYDYDKQ